MSEKDFREIKKVNGLINHIIFGPVESRRFGVSLGINLLPKENKICSFNCPYCECGWTDIKESKKEIDAIKFPSIKEVNVALKACLIEFKNTSDKKIEHVTLAGNGEPTMFPNFDVAIKTLKNTVVEFYPSAKFVLLTNGLHLDRPDVAEALPLIDSLNVKLDAANENIYKKINGPIMGNFHDLLVKIKQLKKFNIQAMFLEGAVNNSEPEHIAEWVQLVKKLNPQEVQVYSIERKAPTDKVTPISKSKLAEIRDLLISEGIVAKSY